MKTDDPEKLRNVVRHTFGKILLENKMIINLEKGIYNYTIQEAIRRKIIRKWKIIGILCHKTPSPWYNLNDQKSLENKKYILR